MKGSGAILHPSSFVMRKFFLDIPRKHGMGRGVMPKTPPTHLCDRGDAQMTDFGRTTQSAPASQKKIAAPSALLCSA